MSLVTRKITNAGDPICDIEGKPLEAVEITFTLVNDRKKITDAWDATTGERIVAGFITAYTDVNGVFSVSLWPNSRGTAMTQYKCRVMIAGMTTFISSLDEGDLSDVSWITFMQNGVPLTLQELSRVAALEFEVGRIPGIAESLTQKVPIEAGIAPVYSTITNSPTGVNVSAGNGSNLSAAVQVGTDGTVNLQGNAIVANALEFCVNVDAAAPLSISEDTGVSTGKIRFDDNYMYRQTGVDQWKRIPLLPSFSVTPTEIELLAGLTGASLQTQLAAKAPKTNAVFDGSFNVNIAAFRMTANAIGIGWNTFHATALDNNIPSGSLAIGTNCLYSLTTGLDNTAVGMGSITGISTGWNNTGLGAQSGAFVDATSADNTFLGSNTGRTVSAGMGVVKNFNGCTAIGSYARLMPAGASINNTTVIGHNTSAFKDNQVMLGNSSVTEITGGAEKAGFNNVGGFMIKLTNKTGAASVKGTVVAVYNATAIDNAVSKIVVDVPAPIGVIYEDGIADGQAVWVVVSGIAEVLFIGNTTRGMLARGFITGDAGYVTGQVLAEVMPAAPFNQDKHNYEIGHVIQTRTGAGLAKVVLHFN